jgi:hypothetical protein
MLKTYDSTARRTKVPKFSLSRTSKTAVSLHWANYRQTERIDGSKSGRKQKMPISEDQYQFHDEQSNRKIEHSELTR